METGSGSSGHGASGSGRRRGSSLPVSSSPSSRTTHIQGGGYNRDGGFGSRGGRSRGRESNHVMWVKKPQFESADSSSVVSGDSASGCNHPGRKVLIGEASGCNATGVASSPSQHDDVPSQRDDVPVGGEASNVVMGAELPSGSGGKSQPLNVLVPIGNRVMGAGESQPDELVEVFDICSARDGAPVMLKPTLLAQNKERRNEMKRALEGKSWMILRPGMVLLKKYLSISDQVKIVKICRDLGVSSGGFYQPGYRDGAKLRLKMMCLGKNWDPETSKYGDRRLVDGAQPPVIPPEFHRLVHKALEDSCELIASNSHAYNVDSRLPKISANICIVNFYSESGKLGLHQDKDESAESLRKGLPVVSFSIGDSAEFLYGDHGDVEKADKVVLESGDVLIFGGNSRHVFHGVSSILKGTARKTLLQETNLRPGRLNLTFREY